MSCFREKLHNRKPDGSQKFKSIFELYIDTLFALSKVVLNFRFSSVNETTLFLSKLACIQMSKDRRLYIDEGNGAQAKKACKVVT